MGRCIICGSRRLSGEWIVDAAVLASGWLTKIHEVVEGNALGIDRSARQWARYNHRSWKTIPADWLRYGPKKAGPIRNGEMARYASSLPDGMCIAIPDPFSKGTLDMIEQAKRLYLNVFVFGWTGRWVASDQLLASSTHVNVEGREFFTRHVPMRFFQEELEF